MNGAKDCCLLLSFSLNQQRNVQKRLHTKTNSLAPSQREREREHHCRPDCRHRDGQSPKQNPTPHKGCDRETEIPHVPRLTETINLQKDVSLSRLVFLCSRQRWCILHNPARSAQNLLMDGAQFPYVRYW